jgi:REP element-mobilizing transposase RayT
VKRESFPRGTPIHVTVRVRKGVPNLRSRKAVRVVSKCFEAACERLGMRLTQYSIQANHIHLIVEAADRLALSRAMKGLCVRIAKRLNRATGRKGSVFADRYHAHILRTPREVRNAVRYVMENSRIHAERRGETWFRKIDPYAGGPCPNRFLDACRKLVVEPRSFILRKVWGLPWLSRSAAPPPAQLRICEPSPYRAVLDFPLPILRESPIRYRPTAPIRAAA